MTMTTLAVGFAPVPKPCWSFGGSLGPDTTLSLHTTLDTDANPTGFVYNSLSIPSGATLTATGSNPLKIFCSGEVSIAGMLNVSGLRGGNAGSVSEYAIRSGLWSSALVSAGKVGWCIVLVLSTWTELTTAMRVLTEH